MKETTLQRFLKGNEELLLSKDREGVWKLIFDKEEEEIQCDEDEESTRSWLLQPPPLCILGCHHSELTTYLGWLIGDQHALPPSDGVFYILGMAVPFHPDQVAGRCNLPWKGKEAKKKQETPFSEARSHTGQQDLPPKETIHLSEHTHASQSLKHPFSRSPLPDNKSKSLSQAHTGYLWVNLNMNFHDPRLSKPKCQLNGSSQQLFQKITPCGFSHLVKAFLFLPQAHTHKANSHKSKFLLFFYKLLALFCCLLSVLILRS